jgi:hypothetical protein
MSCSSVSPTTPASGSTRSCSRMAKPRQGFSALRPRRPSADAQTLKRGPDTPSPSVPRYARADTPSRPAPYSRPELATDESSPLAAQGSHAVGSLHCDAECQPRVGATAPSHEAARALMPRTRALVHSHSPSFTRHPSFDRSQNLRRARRVFSHFLNLCSGECSPRVGAQQTRRGADSAFSVPEPT